MVVMLVMVMVKAMAVVVMVAVMVAMVVMASMVMDVWGIHHRPHLVKHRSGFLQHRANVQDILKASQRSTMQERPSLVS